MSATFKASVGLLRKRLVCPYTSIARTCNTVPSDAVAKVKFEPALYSDNDLVPQLDLLFVGVVPWNSDLMQDVNGKSLRQE